MGCRFSKSGFLLSGAGGAAGLAGHAVAPSGRDLGDAEAGEESFACDFEAELGSSLALDGELAKHVAIIESALVASGVGIPRNQCSVGLATGRAVLQSATYRLGVNTGLLNQWRI
jgi:hypothetical protein